jgi:hypothetical protein
MEQNLIYILNKFTIKIAQEDDDVRITLFDRTTGEMLFDCGDNV